MKIIGHAAQDLLSPVGFIWAYLVAGTVYFCWKQEKRASAGFAFGAILVWLIGSSPIPASLLHRLEKPYVGIAEPAETADALVVLGGIGAPSRTEIFRLDLGMAADRAVTAADLMRRGKARVLVLGGGGIGSGPLPTEGMALREWFATWRLFTNQVIAMEPSRNTEDEADQAAILAKKFGWRKIILVTSAAHMRRAEAIFRKKSLDVSPVACDFVGTRIYEAGAWKIIPDIERFLLTGAYIHEVVGWWVYRWKN